MKKFNLRLICVSQFLFTFFIKIKIKFDKFHVNFNALLRLKFIAIIENISILKNLNKIKFKNVNIIIVKCIMIMIIIKKKIS